MPAPPVAGLILAGGLSRRMGGGDKPLLEVGGQTLLARTVARLKPQARPLLLNANGDPHRFAGYGLPVRADIVEGYCGPLAGILTGLEWAREQGVEWLATAAADTPLFPADLVARLWAARQRTQAELAVAVSGGREHPVFALWPVRLAADLRRAVVQDGVRRMGEFMERHAMARAEWLAAPHDPFFNVNSPEDVHQLAERLAAPE